MEWCEEETMRAIKSLFVGAVVAVGAFVSFGVLNPSMMSASAADCSTNSVIKCGFGTLAELRSKYKTNATGDLEDLYNRYGLTPSVVNGATAKTGTVYKDGRLVVDGKVVGTEAHSVGRHYIAGSTSFKAGGTTFYERPTTVSMISNAMSVIVFYDGNGNVIAAVMHDCGNPVRVKVVPQPEYRCDALTATKINRNTYDFAVAYTAKNGATFKNYNLNYGDGTSVTGRTTNPTRYVYANPGTYTITATVTFNIGTTAVTATCATQVVVDQPPVVDKPGVSIEKTVNGKENEVVKVGEAFTYEVKVTNTGNVALKDAVITDKAPANITFKSADAGTVANNAWTHKVSLAVKESKTFKITAMLDKYVEGQIVNKACVDATEVTGTPDDCDTATIETPKEGEIVVCVIDEKVVKTIKESEFNSTTMTKDTEKCKEVPATSVTELPKTGAADLLGGSLGLGSIAGAAYYYADSRRRIQNAMNRR